VCDSICFNLQNFRKTWIRFIYINIDRLTEADRTRFIEEPLAMLNNTFSRSVGVEAFIVALRIVVHEKNGYHLDELTFIAYIIATSADCKQYVPVKYLKEYYDELHEAGKARHRFFTMLQIARDPGMNACPLGNRQNALFKREVAAMDAMPDQKQSMLQRYVELGLDKTIVQTNPMTSARGIAYFLAKEAGVVDRQHIANSCTRHVIKKKIVKILEKEND